MSSLPEPLGSDSIPQEASYLPQVRQFEASIAVVLNDLGLPSEGIFVPTEQRGRVFANIRPITESIEFGQRGQSIYFSKFLAAVASGLFDAALNYLWDETVIELRKRVARYDLSYFYDNILGASDRRKDFNSEEDLQKIDDSQLIQGARAIDLISEIGFRKLDNIRYMRNWASAAHPNHNQISGFELIAYAEACVDQVISLPLSDVVIEIQRILASIRTTQISASDARETAVFFLELSKAQVSKLAQGLFGIYTRSDSTTQAKQNVLTILPYLWERVEEPVRIQFGVKYGNFVANNDQAGKQLARQFLATVQGESYIPDGLRAAEVVSAVEELLLAHRNYGNFYSEPPLARALSRLVGEHGSVPPQANDTYVLGLVEVFLTNGHGEAWNADTIYRELLQQLNPEQALFAILSFRDETISSRLQIQRCRSRFEELLNMMRINNALPSVGELVDYILEYEGPMDKMKDDDRFMKRLAPYLVGLT